MLQAGLQVKLPYYPNILAVVSETNTGVQEISIPEIYNKPLANGKIIVRVDCLRCLDNVFDNAAFIYRDIIYNIIAGKGDTCDAVSSCYRRFKEFREYVNNCYFFGDDSVPIVDRLVDPMRESVNDYMSQCKQMLSAMGGKYLITTHSYVYFAFNNKPNIDNIKGAITVC